MFKEKKTTSEIPQKVTLQPKGMGWLSAVLTLL